MARDSFVFYKSWAEMMAKMPDKELAELTRALACYQIGAEYTIDDPMVEAVFTMMKGQLDKDAEKYEEVCRIHRESGKKGGRPPKEDETKRLSEEPNETKRLSEKPSADEYDNDMNINMIIKEKGTPKGVPKEKSTKRFSPPTLEEVKSYCAERNNSVDAEHFIDFYQRQDWYLSNGRKMKDWRAAVRNWEYRDKTKVNKFNAFEQRQQTNFDEIEARMFNRRVGT